MPKLNLRRFLRQEINRDKAIKGIPNPQPHVFRKPFLRAPSSPDSLFDDNSVRSHNEIPESDSIDSIESLFNEPAMEEKSTEELQRARLESLLGSDLDEVSKVNDGENNALDGLRKDLETLLMREMEAEGREKAPIRRKKSALIQEIRCLEAAQRVKATDRKRVTLEEIPFTLPEPITAGEKKQMQVRIQQVAKARTGLERSPNKRSRSNPDEDLDGEERLRLGKNVQKKRIQITGHWQYNIHDYFPDADGDGENGTLDGLSAEDKQFLRRELTQLGAELAKIDRKRKALM